PLAGGGLIALSWDARGLEEDCRRATLVVTRREAPAACAESAAVIDWKILATTGALSLTRSGDGFSGVSALDPSGSRPWTRQPATPPPAAATRLVFAATPPLIQEVEPPPVDPTDRPDEADTDDAGPSDDQ
ncbi:ComEC family competence protein, partial [Hansschlegelia beijingensis]